MNNTAGREVDEIESYLSNSEVLSLEQFIDLNLNDKNFWLFALYG